MIQRTMPGQKNQIEKIKDATTAMRRATFRANAQQKAERVDVRGHPVAEETDVASAVALTAARSTAIARADASGVDRETDLAIAREIGTLGIDTAAIVEIEETIATGVAIDAPATGVGAGVVAGATVAMLRGEAVVDTRDPDPDQDLHATGDRALDRLAIVATAIIVDAKTVMIVEVGPAAGGGTDAIVDARIAPRSATLLLRIPTMEPPSKAKTTRMSLAAPRETVPLKMATTAIATRQASPLLAQPVFTMMQATSPSIKKSKRLLSSHQPAR